jgi:flavin-dependent dehydrogenase
VEEASVNALRDAVVIGGGPAGTTAALLLARAGWSVALLERKTFPRRKVCGEYLSATNLPLFDRLGIGERFRALAGAPVTKVSLFAGRTIAQSNLPSLKPGRGEWGRALGREQLDTWLLEQARAEGVDVRQPWTIDELIKEAGLYHCQARSAETGALATIRAAIVIAAHGSWEPGTLPTQSARPPALPTDLLAFKAHFRNSDLPAGLMPLLAFPGGYGGMVHCDGGRVSLSCCIRRDRLARIRVQHPGDAGDAVLAHIQESCLGVRKALACATQDDVWLAAGPIRPGVRLRYMGGLFPVGNAAGEAHPVIAEGISMAMQSAWLLCRQLIDWRRQSAAPSALARVARRYAESWRSAFVPRLNTSRVLAEWAMRPALVTGVLPFIWCCPAMMTWIARLSGKADQVVKSGTVVPVTQNAGDSNLRCRELYRSTRRVD